MATIQKVLVIGTTSIIGVYASLNRKGWRVTMLSSGVAAGNTGRVHVGRGFAPNTVVGDPASGDVLVQSTETKESQSYDGEPIFRGDVWLTASAANQQVSVEETTKD